MAYYGILWHILHIMAYYGHGTWNVLSLYPPAVLQISLGMLGHLLLLLPLLHLSSSSPLEEVLGRVEEYRVAAMESEGCGWWKDILRLHYGVHFSPISLLLLYSLPAPPLPPAPQLLPLGAGGGGLGAAG